MRGVRFRTRVVLGIVLLAGMAWPQAAEKANEGYKTAQDRNRVAQALENPDRETSQKPGELITEIGVHKGSTVADIGTGVGYMLPYLVDAVGPQGFVYAEDIFPDFLAKAESKVREHGWKKVKTVLGTEKDPKLPPRSIDLALILDVYHHFNYPGETMANLRQSLKPDGRVVIVDFYRSREHPRMTPERLKEHIRLDRDGFAAEVEAAGFRLERQFDHLPHQYVLIFKKS